MSANTGVAPIRLTASAVAKKVNDGTITSSPGPIPSARSPSTSASVPEPTPTAWRTPRKLAASRSNASTFGPRMKRPERSTSSTAFSSSGQSASVCAPRSTIGILRFNASTSSISRAMPARKFSSEKRAAFARIAAGSSFGSRSSNARTASASAPGVGSAKCTPVGARPPGSRGPTTVSSAPPRAERDHRPAGGLRLDGDDPEVLVLRVHERATARVELVELAVRDAAEEAHVRGRARLEPRAGRAVAGDHERACSSARNASIASASALYGTKPPSMK